MRVPMVLGNNTVNPYLAARATLLLLKHGIFAEGKFAGSKISEAIANLSDMRVKMEQFYQDNRNYGSSGTTCGVPKPDTKYFSLDCATANSGQGFTVTANNKANVGLGNAAAYVYTIDHSNTRSTTSFKGAATTGKNCWLVTGSEC